MSYNIDFDKPSDWFETLYANSSTKGEGVPWADLKEHEDLHTFFELNPMDTAGKKALVVGGGMGDDALYLEKLGFDVTAIDISSSAITFCKERFHNSNIDFHVADLFDKLRHLEAQFDFVVEIYTIQALPPTHQKEIATNITKLLAPNGKLLLISYMQESIGQLNEGPPWPLHKAFFSLFKECGLTLMQKHKKVKEWGKASHHIVHLYKKK